MNSNNKRIYFKKMPKSKRDKLNINDRKTSKGSNL